MNISKSFAIALILIVSLSHVHADTYALPPTPGDTVIAHNDPLRLPITRAEQNETLLDVARGFSLGQMEIVRLNKDVDRWKVKKGEIVRLPDRRVLPDTPHEGITLNISEYRMYFYPASQPGKVMTYAHGVGRQDWKTPLGKTSIMRKVKDPVWHPPESIRREHAAEGDPLPEIVPAGPHNPLGAYALYLNLPGEYRIHGTDIDKIYGIGMQITHGCVRMYPEDIEELYNNVSVGTPVYLVKQPIKVGWLDNTLYIEAHPDLEGDEITQDERFALALNLIQKANNNELPEFDQTILSDALTKLDGEPVALYERLPPLEQPLPQDSPSPPTQAEPAPIKPIVPPASKIAASKPQPPKPQTAKTAKPTKPLKVVADSKKSADKPGKLAAIKKPAVKTAAAKTVTAKPTAEKPGKTKPITKTAAVKAVPSRKGSPGGYYHGS